MDQYDPYIFAQLGHEVHRSALREAAQSGLVHPEYADVRPAGATRPGAVRHLAGGLRLMLGRCFPAVQHRHA
jgi:hypothetical protein